MQNTDQQRSSGGSNAGSRKLVIWPKGADLAPIKEAVLALNLPFKVIPFWFEPEVSGEDRVLVLADEYPWGLISDSIYPKNPALMVPAIEWCLGLRELERGPRYWKDKMVEAFGPGVKFLGTEPYDG